MKQKRLFRIVGAVVCALSVVRCAHTPVDKGVSAEVLFESACRPGQSNHSVVGSVWMKATSEEAKGQFPASVRAIEPDQVTLEVTNLIGARQALIEVKKGSFTIDVPDQEGGNSRQGQGKDYWGGIPLRWASQLFLGRIPCPPAGTKSLIVRSDPETGELTLLTPLNAEGYHETFVYRFHQWAGRPWPESLHWERQGRGATSVDFKFADPDDKTGSPKKWEAKSPLGEVKLRWTDFRPSS